jgi:hypothetical protein
MCFLTRLLTALLLLLPGMVAPAAAEWGWYSGDIATFSADNTSTTIPESVHNAVESGLDWVVLSADPGAGSFVGLTKLVDEVKLTIPRLTPMLGSGWLENNNSARILGVDARAPIPRSLDKLLSTVSSHQGVVVLESIAFDVTSPDETTIFSPVHKGEWASSVAIGGLWDQALSQGRRVFIAGVSSGSRPAATHTTVLWSEGNQADQLIKSIRTGASYVAEQAGIHVDLQVNGRTSGQTVFHQGEPFIRIKAYAEHPISTVSLIADGEEIWSAKPDKNIWEERFFLPAGDFSYIRAVLHSKQGGYQTLGNPVFLVSENPDSELPLTDNRPVPSTELIEMGGMLEASTGLPEDAQARILKEFLAGTSTRYGTSWLLQNRMDIVSDHVLTELALSGNDPQVQLGAAYALVVRGSSAATDVLLEFLESSSDELQSYAARIFAHYTEGFTEDDWVWNPARSAESNAYLIRAYHPIRFSATHVAQITESLNAEHPALAQAANDKLVDLGTRHYRVIEALLDSARTGNASAADVLGQIGDHRTVSALQGIFAETTAPSLQRSVFLALDRMGAPYPERPSLVLPELSQSPVLDGVITQEEWTLARELNNLRSDWDGASHAPGALEVKAGIRGDTAYIAVSRRLASPFPAATLTDDTSKLIDQDEIVEMTLASPPYDAENVGEILRIRINALGVVDCAESIESRAVSRLSPNQWDLETAIPLEVIRSFSRFNLAIISPTATPSRLAWSVTYGAPENASRFGDIKLEDTARE